MKKQHKNLTFLLSTFMFLTSVFFIKIFVSAIDACPVDILGVSCVRQNTCNSLSLGQGVEKLDYQCDGTHECCFQKFSCPTENDVRFRCSLANQDCSQIGTRRGWYHFKNGLGLEIMCSDVYSQSTPCCHNDNPDCSGAFTCVPSGSCSGTGQYSNDNFCPTEGDVCCYTASQNCNCTSNGGKCSEVDPSTSLVIYTETLIYSCDDNSCIGGAGDRASWSCWVPRNENCGYIGHACCAGRICYEGYAYEGNMQQCQCNSVDVAPPPPEMVYTGPIIESLEEILGPVTKMLYYGGLAIGVFFIILSGYKLMASQGDPQRTKEAQEQLTAAIVGIIFILLSVSIIRVIISQILNM